MSAPELLRCEPPSDDQLRFVAALCRENGYPVPAVYSKQHATLLIDEIRDGQYIPDEWREVDDDVPL